MQISRSNNKFNKWLDLLNCTISGYITHVIFITCINITLIVISSFHVSISSHRVLFVYIFIDVTICYEF